MAKEKVSELQHHMHTICVQMAWALDFGSPSVLKIHDMSVAYLSNTSLDMHLASLVRTESAAAKTLENILSTFLTLLTCTKKVEDFFIFCQIDRKLKKVQSKNERKRGKSYEWFKQ